MPESPHDLRKAVHDANEAIRAHARRDSWTEPDQQRHALLVGEWQTAVAELNTIGPRPAEGETPPAAA